MSIYYQTTLFPVVNFDDGTTWKCLLQLCGAHLEDEGLARLEILLDGKCKSVVVERGYIDKDYRNTFSHFHSKRFITPDSRCVRLHFFEKSIPKSFLKRKNLFPKSNHYLGYSVIRPTRPNCIGRTMLCNSLRKDVASHLCLCTEPVHLLGEKLIVEGFPFISKDGDATMCAESALWMVLRYLSNRYSSYAETLPFQITELANSYGNGNRVFPTTGLYSWQMAEALRLRNVAPRVYDRSEFKGLNFGHLLYTYLESGFPLLTSVDDHVFVALGHSSDFTTKLPPNGSGFAYTSGYNQALTVCDDTAYPYQKLHLVRPKDANNIDSKFELKQIKDFIVPLPDKVFLTAEDAQKAIEKVLNDSPADESVGYKKCSPTLANKNLVLRLFLTTTRAFKRKITERGMGNPIVADIYRQMPMPHFIWVCEIAIQEEYSTDFTVRGEIIWDATRNAKEPDGWLALHYPELLIIDMGCYANLPHNPERIQLDNSLPYGLFRSNLNPQRQ